MNTPQPARFSPPKGWRLVPDRADDEMIKAAEGVEDQYRRGTPETWRKVFREMVAAAPTYKEGN